MITMSARTVTLAQRTLPDSGDEENKQEHMHDSRLYWYIDVPYVW